MRAKFVSCAVSFVALVSMGIGTGCFSSSSDTGDDGAAGADGALSADECNPKADAQKAQALKDCQTANAFDMNACRKPSENTLAKWQAQVDAAYQAQKAKIDPITGDCKKNVDALPCRDLLTSSGQDFSAAAGDQKACDVVKKARETKCDSDASDAIQTALDGDTTYTQLANLEPEVEFKYLTDITSCEGQSVLKSVAAATCPAQALAKRESAYLACRHQCPNIKASACTPDDYKGQDVACGKLTTVSSMFGIFCESGSKCDRTSLCDKYDSSKKDADKINGGTGCTTAAGKPGVLVARVVLASANGEDAGVVGGAGSITTVCQDKPATASH